MSAQQIKIQTVTEYLEAVLEIKQQWPNSVLAFRGQENEKWKLESSAERRLKQSGNQGRILNQSFIEYHENLLSKCKLKNYDRREGKSLHELELLADLRHYGAATYLIDFTRDALVALWFACEKTGPSASGGKVFVVNTAEQTFLEIAPGDIDSNSIEKILRFQTREKGQATEPQDKEALKTTPSGPSFWHWTPAHLNERITAQHSLFLFGLPSSGEPKEQETILIKSENKAQMRQKLKEIHDIHEESLFPDFVGFAYTQRHNAPYTTLDAEGYFRRGVEALQQGELDQAIQDFTQAIERKPDFAEPYNNRGTVYADQGPNLDKVYYNRGNAYREKGGLDQAIRDYSKAIELNLDYVDSYLARGVAYGKNGDFDLAIQDFNKVIKLKPNYAEAYYNRGLACYKQGNYDQAIQDYDKAIALKPDYADAYNNRGLAYDKQGKFDQAIRDYDQAIELKPDDAEAYYNRGNAYLNQDELDQAIQDYSKAIEFKPNLAGAYSNRGNAYLNQDELDQAIQDYNKAIELKPDLAEAYNNRGNVYRLEGNLDQAIQDYSKAIELKSDDAEAYNNRGSAYGKKGDLDQAIQDYNQAIDLKPDLAIAYYNRGVVWLLKQAWDNARADLRAAEGKGANLAELFFNNYGSVPAFEQKYKIQLPKDLREMLTP